MRFMYNFYRARHGTSSPENQKFLLFVAEPKKFVLLIHMGHIQTYPSTHRLMRYTMYCVLGLFRPQHAHPSTAAT